MERQETLDQALNIIHQYYPDLKAIYIFGSFATHCETINSDIDIAVLAEQPLTPFICFQIAQEIAQAIGRDVDLIDLLQASTVFQAQIITQSIKIEIQDNTACSQFEDLVYSKYMRLNDLREPLIQDILKRGTVHIYE